MVIYMIRKKMRFYTFQMEMETPIIQHQMDQQVPRKPLL
ncbi:hypothetical protein Avbf_02811 [Armadillidium vulgare]|nr:hypothetical protein Avbf_02811 [Armadillidium vulgare]